MKVSVSQYRAKLSLTLLVVSVINYWLYKLQRHFYIEQFCVMPSRLHILSFQSNLRDEKKFIKSLVCHSVAKRRLILEKATPKQLQLIQKLLALFLRVTAQFLNRIKRSKKVPFLEQHFKKICSDPNLRQHILSLASILHLFIKVVLKKK